MFNWCWHKWGKWEVFRAVKTLIPLGNPYCTIDSEVEVQRRVCVKCGITDTQELKVYK